jgi:ADP-ribose pyrophosphatase YjhB (NUDIX family)
MPRRRFPCAALSSGEGKKILLVRDRGDGGWCMPGGRADVGDPPSAMVEREVLEESGLRVRAACLADVYDANREEGPLDVMHAYDLVFLCDDLGGEPRSSNETSDAGFFGMGEIPALSGARTSPRQLNPPSCGGIRLARRSLHAFGCGSHR